MLPIFACLFNCGLPVVVSVDAHGSAVLPAGTQVLLVPADPRIPASDPTYVYLAGVVARGLANRGLQPVQPGQQGGKVLAISWRRGQPQVATRQIAEGYTPPDLPNQQEAIGGTVRGLDGVSSLRDALNPGLRDAHTATFEKTTVYPWIIELQGRDTVGQDSTSVWTVTLTATSSTPRNDPAQIAPQMIAAGLPFIGADAHKNVRISVNDPALKAVLDATKPAPEK